MGPSLTGNKDEVEKAAGIPLTIVLPALFAESALGMGLLEVDRVGNRLAIPGDGDNQPLFVCTREYIAAAYASIFAATPVARLQSRVLGLTEVQVTGKELAKALEAKNGAPPKIFYHSLEEVDKNIETALAQGRPLALAWLCRKFWGAGMFPEAIGSDIWELVSYRDAPPEVHAALEKTFY
ncbi:hypothetical protein N7470_006875 [Penicillium chermesinum]|nr:hypothetical protein N7470_006875 [Penicillium chermesinum]